MIAALPMYDFPELREAHDLLWAAIARRLGVAGVASVPSQLTRSLSHRATWMHPGLLFGQACEYPVSKSFRERLRIIATPRYQAPGCVDASYRSAIVVRKQDSAGSLEDLRHRRCVANEADSNSGMNLFRAAVAPLANGAAFFQSVEFSGSHLGSLQQVAAGEADVTAVDCVTLAHLQRHQLQLVSQLRVLDWTPASPCLPFVTSHRTSDDMLEKLRSVLADVLVDPLLGSVRGTLLLEGIDPSPDPAFTRVTQLELEAVRWRYPQLQ